MIVETALQRGGPHAVIVRRPRGVLHVADGRFLTRSGQAVPASLRPECGAATRRLRVVDLDGWDSLKAGNPRMCRRCTRSIAAQTRDWDRPLWNRDEYRRAYAATTPLQLAHELEAAESLEEVTAAAHVALVLFGHRGCVTTRVTRPYGSPSLHELIARRRIHFNSDSLLERQRAQAMADAAVMERRKADRIAGREEREARIARVGIVNAKRGPR